MTTQNLIKTAQFDNGTMFATDQEMLYVLQLKGSWFEMGKQYGQLSKEHIDRKSVV